MAESYQPAALEQRETHRPQNLCGNRTEAQQVGGKLTVVGDGGGREEEEGGEGPEEAGHGRR
jgi:hypothetical protein